ncbi:sigma 54-interacting transcriptional regulator [Lacrimispora indolis]|uniref:sigma 54-interacting transcriptional regulator n=1 Tax=Lacrimispora indolis TaxID=69825 RepID=UPI00048284DC|nr:sigma 54-interacting transcriptional regulator [Lacrimispora indolis]MBE7721882.1 AAA family ATPase [Lacrimispora celerecrescens]
MKKSIAVIALDPFAGKAYARQVRSVFGERAVVRNYSMMDGTAANMEPCDLFMGSTDAFDAMGDPDRYIPPEAQRMEIQVTYLKEAVRRLEEIPKGTKVLYVNITEVMAREAVTQLEQLGITHLKFILYAPGSKLTEMAEIAVTPDEERYVPSGISTIINLGQRTCSSDTMIEAAFRLGFDDLLEEVEFKRYQESVCTNTYYFDEMFNRSRRLESQFDILMEVLDQGVIAVNEHGEIYAVNKNAADITRVPENLGISKAGEEVFPYIPFRRCLEEKKETSPQVVRVAGNLVSLYVRPVLRRDACVGAFAILQKFNEMERRQNELRVQLMKKGQGHRAKYCFDDVIGQSAPILKTKFILNKMAGTESPVLLIGETGTGKELFAHSVHNASKRRDQPFVAINCAAMPENLLESELFGYEEGAFTGAKKGGRPGLFEFAHQGTLFLDEVEGMSPALQVKLLRVLQEREIMRVGGNQIIHVDVRIVAATNEELEQKVAEGTFRQDLYYRLNALPVLIPPLREREEDVFLILDSFRKELGGSFRLSDDIKELFREYEWPGNIRELRNVVDYLCFTGHTVITIDDLPPVFRIRKNRQEVNGIKGEELNPRTSTKPSRYETILHTPTQQEQVILEILYDAERRGQSIGREKILLEAQMREIKLTQPQVRKILGRLEENGYVTVTKGRGGSNITKKGVDWITN